MPEAIPNFLNSSNSLNSSTASYREIYKVAVPVSLEAVFQASFSLVDQIVVGVLGASAVAAVGLSNNISLILTLLYSAIGTGSGALIAQAYGRKDMAELSRIAVIGQVAALVLGGLTALPLILFPTPILKLIGAQPDVVEMGAGYLRLFAAAAPLMVMSAVTTAAFRSMSDARTPMAITMAAMALNTVLAVLLVLGISPFPKLGVIGAGLATLISQLIRCAALLTVLYASRKEMKWRRPTRSELQRIGPHLFGVTYPIALSELLWGTSTFVYTFVFTHLGTVALAASQIVTTVENLFIVAATGLAPAAVAAVGQALGREAVSRAKKLAGVLLRLSLIAGLIFTAGLIVGGFLLPLIYPRVGRDVLQLAFWGAIIVALVQPAKVVNSYLGSGLLPSGGDTKFVLLTHVVSSYLIGLPVAGIFGIALKIGAWTVFAARGLEEIVKAVMLILRARTGNWQRKL